jgi:hypothetical protein
MRTTPIVTAPAKAFEVQAFLDILLQFLNLIEAIGRIFGINFSGLFGGGN